MDRRGFVAGTLALLAAPLATEAQPAGKVYRIGYLSLGSPSDGVSGPFRDTLRQMGYVEGQNLLIEARFADARVDQLPGLAADLVRRNVDVIVTIGTPPVKAAKEATAAIPIVMAGSASRRSPARRSKRRRCIGSDFSRQPRRRRPPRLSTLCGRSFASSAM